MEKPGKEEERREDTRKATKPLACSVASYINALMPTVEGHR